MGAKFKLIIYMVYAVAKFEFTFGQVIKSETYLSEDLQNKLNGEENYKTQWFMPYSMTNPGKFMLCVDVYQKLEKNRLMEGRFMTYQVEVMDLPEFEVNHQAVLINNKEQLKDVISCPLHEVSFEKLSYNYGSQFYITESINEYCVYALTPTMISSNTSSLKITSEVCALLINVTYNSHELEQKFLNYYQENSFVPDMLHWPNLDTMSPEDKFMICADVCDKITRVELYNEPFDLYYEDLLTLTSTVGYLKLTNYATENPLKYVQALFCQIEFFKAPRYRKRSWLDISSFYLSHSVNNDCFYKLGSLEKGIENDLPPLLYIQGEICGFSGTVYTNISKITTDFHHTWSVRVPFHTINTSFYEVPWVDVVNMDPINLFSICENVYKKLHKKRLAGRYLGIINRLTLHNYKLSLHDNILISSLYCPLNEYTKDENVRSFYVTGSVNINCVYVLHFNVDKFRTYNEIILEIDVEVCGVYPTRHFLNIEPSEIIQPVM